MNSNTLRDLGSRKVTIGAEPNGKRYYLEASSAGVHATIACIDVAHKAVVFINSGAGSRLHKRMGPLMSIWDVVVWQRKPQFDAFVKRFRQWRDEPGKKQRRELIRISGYKLQGDEDEDDDEGDVPSLASDDSFEARFDANYDAAFGAESDDASDDASADWDDDASDDASVDGDDGSAWIVAAAHLFPALKMAALAMGGQQGSMASLGIKSTALDAWLSQWSRSGRAFSPLDPRSVKMFGADGEHETRSFSTDGTDLFTNPQRSGSCAWFSVFWANFLEQLLRGDPAPTIVKWWDTLNHKLAAAFRTGSEELGLRDMFNIDRQGQELLVLDVMERHGYYGDARRDWLVQYRRNLDALMSAMRGEPEAEEERGQEARVRAALFGVPRGHSDSARPIREGKLDHHAELMPLIVSGLYRHPDELKRYTSFTQRWSINADAMSKAWEVYGHRLAFEEIRTAAHYLGCLFREVGTSAKYGVNASIPMRAYGDRQFAKSLGAVLSERFGIADGEPMAPRRGGDQSIHLAAKTFQPWRLVSGDIAASAVVNAPLLANALLRDGMEDQGLISNIMHHGERRAHRMVQSIRTAGRVGRQLAADIDLGRDDLRELVRHPKWTKERALDFVLERATGMSAVNAPCITQTTATTAVYQGTPVKRLQGSEEFWQDASWWSNDAVGLRVLAVEGMSIGLFAEGDRMLVNGWEVIQQVTLAQYPFLAFAPRNGIFFALRHPETHAFRLCVTRPQPMPGTVGNQLLFMALGTEVADYDFIKTIRHATLDIAPNRVLPLFTESTQLFLEFSYRLYGMNTPALAALRQPLLWRLAPSDNALPRKAPAVVNSAAGIDPRELAAATAEVITHYKGRVSDTLMALVRAKEALYSAEDLRTSIEATPDANVEEASLEAAIRTFLSESPDCERVPSKLGNPRFIRRIEELIQELDPIPYEDVESLLSSNSIRWCVDHAIQVYAAGVRTHLQDMARQVLHHAKTNFEHLDCATAQSLADVDMAAADPAFTAEANILQHFFQMLFGSFVRPDQWAMVKTMRPPAPESKHRVYQFRMGKGKSSVITPLLLMSDTDVGIAFTVPPHLVRQSAHDLHALWAYTGAPFTTVSDERAKSDLLRNWEDLERRITEDADAVRESDIGSDKDIAHINWAARRLAWWSTASKWAIFDEFTMMHAPSSSNLNRVEEQVRIPKEGMAQIKQLCRHAFLGEEVEGVGVTMQYEFSALRGTMERMRLNIDYGAPSTDHVYAAVPYARKDSPLDGSRFRTLLLTMLLSFQMYFQTPTLFGSQTSLRRAYEMTVSRNLRMPGIPTSVYTDTEDDENEFAAQAWPFYRDGMAWAAEKRFDAAWFIVEYLVTLTVFVPRELLNCSFQDIAGDDTVVHKVGFSGSADMEMMDYRSDEAPRTFDPEVVRDSDELVSVYVALVKDPHAHFVGTVETPESVLSTLKGGDYHMLVDAAAIFRDWSNRQVVDAVRALSPRYGALSYAYLDEKNRKWLLTPDGAVTALGSEAVWTSDRFYFYGQKHIVGIDMKQPPSMRCLLVASDRNTYTDVSQAAYRARRLNRGHIMDTAFYNESGIADVPADRQALYAFYRQREMESIRNQHTSLQIQATKFLARHRRGIRDKMVYIENDIAPVFMMRRVPHQADAVARLQKALHGGEKTSSQAGTLYAELVQQRSLTRFMFALGTQQETELALDMELELEDELELTDYAQDTRFLRIGRRNRITDFGDLFPTLPTFGTRLDAVFTPLLRHEECDLLGSGALFADETKDALRQAVFAKVCEWGEAHVVGWVPIANVIAASQWYRSFPMYYEDGRPVNADVFGHTKLQELPAMLLPFTRAGTPGGSLSNAKSVVAALWASSARRDADAFQRWLEHAIAIGVGAAKGGSFQQRLSLHPPTYAHTALPDPVPFNFDPIAYAAWTSVALMWTPPSTDMYGELTGEVHEARTLVESDTLYGLEMARRFTLATVKGDCL